MGSARSIGILTVLNIFSAAIAVASSVVVARLFGTSRMVEVFFAAQRLDLAMAQLTQSGQVAEILLPLYHRIKHSAGAAAAQTAFAIILNWFLLAVLALSALAWFLAPLLLNIRVPGFTDADRMLCVAMFRWIVPLLALQIAVNLMSSYIHAEARFGPAESLGVAATALTLGLIVVFAHVLPAPARVWAMVVSLWGGQLFQFVGHVVLLHRLGYRHRWRLRHADFSAWSVFGKLFSTMGYVGATQVYGFGLDAALSVLPQGNFAVFNYVQRLFDKGSGIVLRPISVVFFTAVSQALARGAANVRALARDALARYLVLVALAVTAVTVAGRPLLAGLWGGPAFPPDEVRLASHLLTLYFLLLLPLAMSLVVRKTMMSLNMVQRVYLSTAAVQVVSGLLAWGAVRWLHLGLSGVMGIIAVNLIALWLAPFLFLLACRRDLALMPPGASCWRWALACGAAVGLGWLVHWQVPFPAAKAGQLLEAGVLILLGAAVVVACAWLLNVPGFRRDVRTAYDHVRALMT